MKKVKIFLELLNNRISPPKEGWHYIRVVDGQIILCVMKDKLYQDIVISEEEFDNPEILCDAIVKAMNDQERKMTHDDFLNIPQRYNNI